MDGKSTMKNNNIYFYQWMLLCNSMCFGKKNHVKAMFAKISICIWTGPERAQNSQYSEAEPA